MRAIALALLPDVFAAAKRQGYGPTFIEAVYQRWSDERPQEPCRFAGQKGPPAQCTCDSCRAMMLSLYFDQVKQNFGMVR